MKLLILILLAGTAFAQVPIQDASPGGSPITLSGLSNDVSGTNVASKEILAYVISFDGSTTFRKDYYFRPAGFEAGTTITLGDLTRDPNYKESTKTPVATSVWVQFVDGSQWGDQAVGANWISGRAGINQLLAQSLAAYQKGGLSSLTAVLNQAIANNPPRSTTALVAQHLTMLAETDAIADINSRLASAAAHDKTLAGK